MKHLLGSSALLAAIAASPTPLAATESATKYGSVTYAVEIPGSFISGDYYGVAPDEDLGGRYGLTTFNFTAADFGGPIRDIVSAELTLTVNATPLSVGTEVQFFFVADSGADLDSGTGDFSALSYNPAISPTGVEPSQFVTPPQPLGRFDVPMMEERPGGETDTLPLQFTGPRETAVIDAINNGRSFQIIVAAGSGDQIMTYSGVDNTNDPGPPRLSITAVPAYPDDAPPAFPRILNGQFAPGAADIGDFDISADGKHVVYLAEQDTAGTAELFSVPVDGGAAVRLNADLVPGGLVLNFDISPDGRRVVYGAEQDQVGVRELFSVPITGGTPLKLNSPLVAGGSVQQDWQISPDGTRVLYRADQETEDAIELFSVPIDGPRPGAEAFKVNHINLYAGLNVTSFQISPDSRRVVYRSNQFTQSIFELWSRAMDGGNSVYLNGIRTFGRQVTGFKIAPDSQRVIYFADHDTAERFELYSVPITGGSINKVVPDLPEFSEILSTPFPQFSSDGAWVVFMADLINDDEFELHSTPVERVERSWQTIRLSFAPMIISASEGEFQTSPTGTRVVYRAGNHLYSTTVDSGGGTVRLSGDVFDSLANGVRRFQITPSGTHVVYEAEQDRSYNDLYSVPIEGGSATQLTAAFDRGMLGKFFISPDSERVICYAKPPSAPTANLALVYSIPLGGGQETLVSGERQPGEFIDWFGRVRINTVGPHVIYTVFPGRYSPEQIAVGKAQAHWTSPGGSWDAAPHWSSDSVPDRTVEAVISTPALVRFSGAAEVESLAVGGAGGPAVLQLENSSSLRARWGAQLFPGAVLQGDGQLTLQTHALHLPPRTELRAREGERFTLHSGPVTNAGRIEAFGTGFAPAEIDISGALTNAAGTGIISAHDAVLRFPQGVTNHGAIVFASGLNDLVAPIDNQPGAIIAVSGGATAIFYEDVTNSSVINVSASGALHSSAVFFGALVGNGVSGGGAVFIEGDARPGFSPGTMTFGGDLSYGPLAKLHAEIGGTTPGTGYDRLTVAGHLTLGGTLEVSLLPGFVPTPGMAFDLWDAGSVSGAFSNVRLPALPDGRFWRTAEISSTGVLRVANTPESYTAFAAHYALTTPEDGDQDSDGRPNLFEYLAGSIPTDASDSTDPLWHDSTPQGTRLMFLSALPAAADLSVELQTSTTLLNDGPGAWTTIASRIGDAPWTGSAPVEITPAGDGLQQIAVTHQAAGVRRFYRLMVRTR